MALGGFLALLTLVLHLLTCRGYGYFRDEFYYLACARHLALGYVDHPPLLELLLGVTRPLLGDSLPALRLLPAVAAATLVFLTTRMAAALGGGSLAIVTAAVPVMLAPIYLGLFTILSPNALDAVCWTLAMLVLLRLLKTEDARLWLPFGAVVGLGLETKHSMLFLAFGVLVGLVATPSRRQFASRGLWLGGAVAGLLFLPNLAWEAGHGWPTVEFMRNAQQYKNLSQGPLAFLTEQVLVMNPLALPIWAVGLAFYLFARAGKRYRALGWTYLGVLVLMLVGKGKAYYLAPVYPMLFAAGAVVIERALPRAGWALPALVGVSGLLLAPLAKPILPVETFIPYAKRLGQDPAAGVGERHELGKLPQFFADMHGWPEMVDAVARVHAALPPADRARACIFTRNYGEAGAGRSTSSGRRAASRGPSAATTATGCGDLGAARSRC